MAKQYAKNRLVRSDQRLLALGLFSALLLIAMLYIFQIMNATRNSNQSQYNKTQAERIIKTEEFPANVNVTTPDQSFAAENE